MQARSTFSIFFCFPAQLFILSSCFPSMIIPYALFQLSANYVVEDTKVRVLWFVCIYMYI